MEATLKYCCPQTGCRFLSAATCNERIKRVAGEKKTVTAYSDPYWICAGCSGPSLADSAVSIHSPGPPPKAKPKPVHAAPKIVEKPEVKKTTPAPVAVKPPVVMKKRRPSRAKKPDTFNLHLLRHGASRVFPASMWSAVRNAVNYLNKNTGMELEYRKLADGVKVTWRKKESTALPVRLRRHIITCITCGRKFRGINAASCPECREKAKHENRQKYVK